MRKYLDYNYYKNNKSIKNYIKRLLNNYKYKQYISNINYKYNSKLLDNHQKEALFLEENNMLVLASAGSGKTFIIEAKIDYLIKHGIKEKDILVLSFTNNSVSNLKSKIKYNIDIFTFHKLALEIISDYKKSYKIVNDYLSYIVNEIFLSICKNISSKDLLYFNNEITNFINLYKSYYSDSKYLDKITKRSNNKLLKLINKIYYIYEEELYSSGLIDFNDMINFSTKLIKEKGLKRYYKYIIIDEFQDISISRYNLIKIIKESCSSKIFAVGDDYQSIYKFSGSNINMIINFKKYFGYTNIIKLNKTFRNSYELIKVSTSFINKNRYQIKKDIISDKHLDKPIKIVYYIKNMDIKLQKILDLNMNFTILCRYNIGYTTIHKSKGLEYENVIIVKLDNTFPNRRDNKLNNLLLPKDKYLFEEERRLFYVALTRTKNYVYLLVDKEKPSIFVKELLRYGKKYIEELDL